ncbi:MAG TPA: MMPL family transporter [Methanocella sp.]|nr:MMPL family transporter [Methanocella sp.]
MFKELGQFITRHPWAIIAIWIIVLLLALPLAATFSDKLSYNMDTFIPKDLESIHAQDLYKEKFPDTSRSQMIVATVSKNKTATAKFIDQLNRSVNNGSISNITSTSSIYDIQRKAIINASPDLHTGLIYLYNNTTNTNKDLYNATDTVLNASKDIYDLRDNITKINSQLYEAWGKTAGASKDMYDARDGVVTANNEMYQLKGVADVLFGVPNAYASAWNNSTPSIAMRKSAANGAAMSYINSNITPSNQQLAMGYLQGFNESWDDVPPDSTPQQYADKIIQAYSDGFITQNVPSDSQQMMLGVRHSLTIPAYNDPSALTNAIVSMTIQSGGMNESDRPRMTAIYNLGPNPSGSAIDSLTLSLITTGMSDDDAAQAREVYALGNDKNRIGNYIVDKAVNAQDNTTIKGFIRDAWNLGPQATDKDFDDYVTNRASKDMNASEKADFLEIYSWGPKPNNTTISNYVFRKAGKNLNSTEIDFLHQVYALGDKPNNTTIKSFIVSKVNKDLNITGNLSYLYALTDLDRNASKAEVETFATDWANTHGYDNPRLMPDSVINGLASDNLTLYVIGTTDSDDSQAAKDSVTKVRSYVTSLEQRPEFSDIKVYVTGSAAMSLDSENAAMNDVGNIDRISIILILLLLGLYFRSFLTPFVPLTIIAIAIGIAFGALNLISGVISLYNLVMTFVMVIMLGAGTDYCVFLLSRYSEERSKGAEQKTAIITAVEHSGKSVASSGTTAMIGFSSLLIIDRGIFGGIGISIAVGILTAILVAITLLPAVLTLAGDRLFWPHKIHNTGNRSTMKNMWSKITRKVIRHSRLILALGILICIPAVFLASHIALGNDMVAMMPSGIESKQGFDAINSEFGSGTIDRIMILATLPNNATDNSGNFTQTSLDRIEQLSSTIAGISGVDKVNSATRPEGTIINYKNISSYPIVERGYYQSYMNDSLGNDNKTAVLYASFKGSPYSENNMKAIDNIRSELSNYTQGEGKGVTVTVGGTPAGIHDYQNSCTNRYPLVYLTVFIGIFLVLAALLRSIFTPLRLIITLLMSVCWTLGAYVLIFQNTLGYVTSWIIPIFLFCALMGLGVDYDIFLVSRVREEVMNGKKDEDAIETAVESTGSIITLCGSVMASAFGSMLFSTSPELQEFGFVLFFAIILDATVIRLVLVPSIMVLMKKYNWWMPFLGTGTKNTPEGDGKTGQTQEK